MDFGKPTPSAKPPESAGDDFLVGMGKGLINNIASDACMMSFSCVTMNLAGGTNPIDRQLFDIDNDYQQAGANVTSVIIGVAGLMVGGQGVSKTGKIAAKADDGADAARAGRMGTRICSFTAGTQVQMCDGSTKSIEQVEEGDYVLARDEKTGAIESRPAVAPYANPDRAIIELELTDADGHTELIETTDNHPFWVDGQGWTRVDELAPDDRIPSAFGGWLRVTSATWTQRVETVYNFGVEEYRSYFVGESGAWVHNCEEARKVIAGLPEAIFRKYNCKDCAGTMRKALQDEGIGGQVLNIKAKQGDFIVNDLIDGGASTITRNGTHQAVKVGDTVFDNFFKNGIPYEDYVGALGARGGVEITSTPF